MDVIDLNGSLDWEPFDIPGGTEPVSLVRLRSEPETRAFTLLVRFPAGWKRPAEGFYEAAEDVVFLSGALQINDVTYSDGEWAHMPVGYPRRISIAHEDTLAVARFSGPARWRQGLDGASRDDALHRRLDHPGDMTRSPLGAGLGTLLRAGTPDSSWLVHAPLPGSRAPVDAEVHELASRRRVFVACDEPFPDLEGACFCRTFSAGGSS